MPTLFVRALPHHSSAPPFELSSLATPAPADEPRATWVPPERIVVEPEVVPYRPAAGPAAGPAASPAVASVAAPARAAPRESSAADGVPTTVAKRAKADPASPASSTTVATTTTAPGPVLTLPPALGPALAPLLPASTKAVTPVDSGPASWFHAPDGTCAHRSIPKGTVVTVTRVSTGVSTTCVVDDWGPADTSRVIDLSFDTFELLASPDSGVIEVTLAW